MASILIGLLLRAIGERVFHGSLCERCEAMHEVRSASGVRYLLCGRAAADARFRKYPPQPVLQCSGFEQRNAGRSRGAKDATRDASPADAEAPALALTPAATRANLARYYALRAAEYERIYDKPERQEDLRRIEQILRVQLRDRTVLDVACGAGYWIERYQAVARSVVGLDLAEEVLALARAKEWPPGKVEFLRGDALALEGVEGSFDAAVLGFWWSHLDSAGIDSFLSRLASVLAPGAIIVAMDNRFVEGNSTPISRRDAAGNTYQVRRLDGGAEFEILKNFPTEAELRASVARHATGVEIEWMQYFWLMACRTKR